MGFVFEGLQGETYDRTYTDRQLIARIAHYFRLRLPSMLSVIGATVLGALCDALLPFFLALGLDSLVGSMTTARVALFVGMVLLVGVGSWLCGLFRQTYAARIMGDVVLQLRQDAFTAVIKQDLAFFDQHASGKIVSRITSDTEDFATTVTLTISLLSQLLLILIITCILFVLNARLAIIAVLFVPAVVGIALLFRQTARRTMQRVQRATAQINASVQESISGLPIAKNFSREQRLYNEFDQINRQSYRAGMQQGLLASSVLPTLVTTAGLGTVALVYFGGSDVLAGAITLGYWLLFVQSIDLFWLPLTNIASFWSRFQQGLAASERIFALLDAPSRLQQEGGYAVECLTGQIQFKDVSFRYTEQEEVLSHFHLTIQPGETVALVGHTGAGKSTICKLIARFYEFQAGDLLIDGRSIRSLDLGQYRRQLGVVPQTPYLFSGTVAENIRYLKPEATDEEVMQVASSISGGLWLETLPQGIDTQVDEGGRNLSLGQRQLVALSRVLLQNPSLLVLDEATASIDPLTEAQLQEGLDLLTKQRTTIIIAHRLSTVQRADRIIVLRKGQIVEEGTHQQLLQLGGYYSELYNTYFRHQELDYEPGKGFVVTLAVSKEE